MSILFLITRRNWIFMWAILEINAITFIAYILNKNSLAETERIVKYFLIQALGSSLMLIAIIIFLRRLNTSTIRFILLIGIFIKLGFVPFHVWVPQIFISLRWFNIFLLSTIQKIAPLIFILEVISNWQKFSIFFLAIINRIIRIILAINQSSIRSLIAYSSINHIRWIIVPTLYNKDDGWQYFIIYAFSFIVLSIFFIKANIYWSHCITIIINRCILNKPTFFFVFLSFAGLPPLLGFYPKFIVLISLTIVRKIFSLIIIILSAMGIYFYIIVFLMSLLNFNTPINNIFTWLNRHTRIFFVIIPIALIFFSF